MEQYKVTLNGLTPLIMHNDNLAFTEKIKTWQKDPENKVLSIPGDDRAPAWTWIGYLYHDGQVLGMPADNLMTMLREGGAKVPLKGQETYKKQTQSGIMIDQQQWTVTNNGSAPIKIADIRPLLGNLDFGAHVELTEKLGFELFVKSAKIGKAKHKRVRPMFRMWKAEGSLTVIDSELTGLTEKILNTILLQAGSLCGLGDWRPSSPSKSGTFGRFAPVITRI